MVVVHAYVSAALTVLTLARVTAGGFVELSASVVGGPHRGRLAAFSDINNDKQVDVLLISGHTIVGLIAGVDTAQLTEHQLIDNVSGSIVSVVPADFDGDLKNDLLVAINTSSGISCSVYFQEENLAFPARNAYNFSEFVDEPLVFDYNGDTLPDLLVETSLGHRTVFVSELSRNFSASAFSGTNLHPFLKPHVNSFADWDGDRAADLILVTDEHIEIWPSKIGFKDYSNMIPHDKGMGQTALTDFDADGRIDLIAIMSSNVTDSLVILQSEKPEAEFETIALNLNYSCSRWRFAATDGFPPRLVMGDYDNDGYPDAVAVLQNEASGMRYAVPLRNVPCNIDEPRACRTMDVAWDSMLTVAPGAVAAAFYDLLENGALDILVSAVDDGQPQAASSTSAVNDAASRQKLHVFQNSAESFACFLKVAVVSGLCEGSCTSPRPYTNQPGPSISYTSVHADGAAATAVGAQLYQTAHSALLLPYVTFGLGETPNFVDALTVGLPPSRGQEKWTREWTMVIPNAYVVVLPHPPNDPSGWQQKLMFIAPGRQAVITGAVLASLCVLAAIIIGLLQWREKKEDNAEKRQEAQRFHFNAL